MRHGRRGGCAAGYRFLSVLFLVLAVGSTRAAPQRDWDQCDSEKATPDVIIAACSRIIAAGKEKPDDLAAAYSNRAAQWHKKKEYDRAIADVNGAIRLKPTEAALYSDRADTWCSAFAVDHRAGSDGSGDRTPPHLGAVVVRPGGR